MEECLAQGQGLTRSRHRCLPSATCFSFTSPPIRGTQPYRHNAWNLILYFSLVRTYRSYISSVFLVWVLFTYVLLCLQTLIPGLMLSLDTNRRKQRPSKDSGGDSEVTLLCLCHPWPLLGITDKASGEISTPPGQATPHCDAPPDLLGCFSWPLE